MTSSIGKTKILKPIVWYVEKERRSDIETWSIDRVLNKEHFQGKKCGKCAPKTSPRLLNFL